RAERLIPDARHRSDASECVTERATKPGDIGDRCVRRPEALRAGHTRASVFEHAGHRVAVLQADGGGLSGRLPDARAAATASDRAVVGGVGITGPTASGQYPTRWHQLLHRIAARFQLSLSVRLRAREREVDIPRTG